MEVFKLAIGMALEERSKGNKHLKRPWLGEGKIILTPRDCAVLLPPVALSLTGLSVKRFLCRLPHEHQRPESGWFPRSPTHACHSAGVLWPAPSQGEEGTHSGRPGMN